MTFSTVYGLLSLGILGSTGVASLLPRSYQFDPSSCSDPKQRAIIRNEFQKASDMAGYAQSHYQEGPFFDAFFPQSLSRYPQFDQTMKNNYGKLSGMASPNNNGYKITVTCSNDSIKCRGGYLAHMNDGKNNMNFCEKFFAGNEYSGNKAETVDTESYVKACKANECHSDTLYFAYRTKSTTILHEMTHTTYAMTQGEPALDYAYGVNDCKDLALDQFDRSERPYGTGNNKYKNKKKGILFCPSKDDDQKEGICDPEFAQTNADSYALVAAGVYFSDQCGKPLSLESFPVGAPPKFASQRRARDLTSGKLLEARRDILVGNNTSGNSSCALLPAADNDFQPDAVFSEDDYGDNSTNITTSSKSYRMARSGSFRT